MASYAVVCAGLSVDFGSFRAVEDVSIRLDRGRIHAIVGQNGAGKTTFAKVIAGLQERSSGSLSVNGVELPNADRRAARRAGVEMVHQHAALVPDLTVAEALELGHGEPRRAPYRRSTIERRWASHLEDRGIDVDVSHRIRDLSVEAVQSLEIAATDPGPGGLLVLDEPTASLPPQRVGALFARLRAIVENGTTVVVVLHKLTEVRRLADTVTVLRDGSLALPTTELAEVDDVDLSRHIVGVELADVSPLVVSECDGSNLELARISASAAPGDHPLGGVDLRVVAGRRTGIAGVDGNGQRTLVEAIVGLRAVTAGSIRFGRDDWTSFDVATRRAAGCRAVPFDRFVEGSAPDLSLWSNLTTWDAERARRSSRWPLLSRGRLRERASELLASTNVAYQHLDQSANSLSGGNLQRLILARELEGARLMVAAHPTRGLDIAGIRLVWNELAGLVSRGVPVLAVSSDLDELIEHCDHIAVMRSGRVVGLHNRPFDRDSIGRDMIGAQR